MYWNEQWTPICGHYFWDNNVGADLFCQKLGFSSGVLSSGLWTDSDRSEVKLESDAIRIGKCAANDKWLNCTGGCNDLATGGHCPGNSNAKCSAGDLSGITIECLASKYHNYYNRFLAFFTPGRPPIPIP